MKIFFSLLLIANIAFGLVQWLLPYDQLIQRNKQFPVAEELRLLDEPVESRLFTETEASNPQPTTELLLAEETTDTRLCYTIGPFKDRTKALEVSRRYSNRQVKTELKSSLEKEYLGVMVYLSGNKTRQDAIDVAEELATRGFRDYMIINEPGKSNALSLPADVPLGCAQAAQVGSVRTLPRQTLPPRGRARGADPSSEHRRRS